EERYALGKHARVADALAVERDAFVKTAQLQRMGQAEAARRVQIGHRLDLQDHILKAFGEGRGQPLERAPRDRVDLRFGRNSAGQAFGGRHAAGTRDGRYARQPCPVRRALLDGRIPGKLRSGGRVVEGARLESEYTAKPRSEEHTSELQSPYDLVCRLLLEKK